MENTIWVNLKRELKEDFKLRETKLLCFATFLVVIPWILSSLLFFVSEKGIYWVRIITLAIFIITDIFYVLRKKRRDNFFTSWGDWLTILILVAMLVLYLVLSFKSLEFKILSLLAFVFVVLAVLVINGFVLLVKSERSFWIILPYIALVSATIVFFGFTFTFSQINYSNGTLVKNAWDYIYFSSSTFYASTYGDIIPTGALSKFLTQIEIFFSFIIHIFLVGYILSKPRKSEK
ncbi:MAG: ion channel [Nanoarchaeota archaeon]